MNKRILILSLIAISIISACQNEGQRSTKCETLPEAISIAEIKLSERLEKSMEKTPYEKLPGSKEELVFRDLPQNLKDKLTFIGTDDKVELEDSDIFPLLFQLQQPEKVDFYVHIDRRCNMDFYFND